MIEFKKYFFLFIVLFIYTNINAQNYALKFDGKDDQIDIFMERLTNWTISAWIKNDGSWDEKETIVGSGWITLKDYWEDYPLLIKNGYVENHKTNNLISPFVLDDSWHHVAVSNDSLFQKIIIDGEIVSKTKGSKPTVPSFIGSSDGKEFFSGMLDEVRIWDIALDEKIIEKWMNKHVDQSHPYYKNLQLYFTFDDKALDATDYTGNGFGNIKPDNGPLYVLNKNNLFKYRKSKNNESSNYKTLSSFPQSKKVINDSLFSFKLMTWNIWHGGKEFGDTLGPERVIEIIKKSGADIITIQETYGSGPKISEALGYNYYPIGEEGSNLSILSRFPIIDTLQSKFHSFYCGGVIIKLPNEQQIIVFDTWLNYKIDITLDKFMQNVQPEYFMKNDSLSNTANIKKIFKNDIDFYCSNKNIPVIISGDFNSCSHLDWTKEYINLGHSNGLVVQHPNSKFMEANGFIDSYRSVHPNVNEYPGATWSPLYKYNQPVGDRIDFIYFKGENILAAASEVISEYPNLKTPFPSDHAAVLTTFYVDN